METWLHAVKHNIPRTVAGEHCIKCKRVFTDDNTEKVARIGNIILSGDSVLLTWQYFCLGCSIEIVKFIFGGERMIQVFRTDGNGIIDPAQTEYICPAPAGGTKLEERGSE